MALPGSIKVFVSSAFILTFFSAAELAQATEGYFRDGRGARNQGRAGTGVAYSQDALAPDLNPAGLVLSGERLDISLSLFSPRRNYSVTGDPSGAPATATTNNPFARLRFYSTSWHLALVKIMSRQVFHGSLTKAIS